MDRSIRSLVQRATNRCKKRKTKNSNNKNFVKQENKDVLQIEIREKIAVISHSPNRKTNRIYIIFFLLQNVISDDFFFLVYRRHLSFSMADSSHHQTSAKENPMRSSKSIDSRRDFVGFISSKWKIIATEKNTLKFASLNFSALFSFFLSIGRIQPSHWINYHRRKERSVNEPTLGSFSIGLNCFGSTQSIQLAFDAHFVSRFWFPIK